MNDKNRANAPRATNDPIQELALAIYTRMCAEIYSVPECKKPDPKAVARLSLRLAEAFVETNLEFNPIARAAREAKEAVAAGTGQLDIDFASIGATGDINASPRSSSRHSGHRAVSVARAA